MNSSGIAIAIVIATASLPCVATAQKRIAPETTVSADEPFRTFRQLDQKLTVLQTQQHSLKAALYMHKSSTTGAFATPWVAPAHTMRKTIVSIQRLLRRPEHLYKIRHRPFGVHLFSIVRIRAEAVRRNTASVEIARNRTAAYSKEQQLEKAIVSLIVQFQAASGGYGAVHCPRKAWICCEPKRKEDLQSGELAACRWSCVQRSTSCAGFVGPRVR
jgi:hypothetical protein